MKWRWIAVLLFIFLLPSQALAVDYDITDVNIDAQLEPDGTVNVTERHRYEFSSKFNGMIREIIPAEEASIQKFKAFEEEKPLKVEKKKDEYRIHRKGKDETVTITLTYQIVNGMQKYEDGAQFYWPFFDSRNESDYGNMTIHVIPPAKASDVFFLGYDSAERTGKADGDGQVTFDLGFVESGENGDIRTVFEPELFPEMTPVDRKILPYAKAEKRRLEAERLAAERTKEKVKSGGGATLGVLYALLAAIALVAWQKYRKLDAMAEEKLRERTLGVPDSSLSMPATLLFMKGDLQVESLSSALLDLIRKGHVRQTSKDTFELLNEDVGNTHEQQLIDLLFHEVGDGRIFSLKKMSASSKDPKQASRIMSKFVKWRTSVNQEMKDAGLLIPVGLPLTLLILSAVTGTVLFFVFLINEFYLLMTLAIIYTIIAVIFAFVYRPKNSEGRLLQKEWQRMDDWLRQNQGEGWNSFSHDDQFRLLLFGIGMKHEDLESYYAAFKQAGGDMQAFSRDMSPIFIASSFTHTSANVQTYSGGSSGGGGGTGGGGGGSGAF